MWVGRLETSNYCVKQVDYSTVYIFGRVKLYKNEAVSATPTLTGRTALEWKYGVGRVSDARSAVPEPLINYLDVSQ